MVNSGLPHDFSALHLQCTRYERLPARQVDLVGDFAGNELFLIEGDSLLLQCIGNSDVNFDSQSIVLINKLLSLDGLTYSLCRCLPALTCCSLC